MAKIVFVNLNLQILWLLSISKITILCNLEARGLGWMIWIRQPRVLINEDYPMFQEQKLKKIVLNRNHQGDKN